MSKKDVTSLIRLLERRQLGFAICREFLFKAFTNLRKFTLDKKPHIKEYSYMMTKSLYRR